MSMDFSGAKLTCVCGHKNPVDNKFCEACGKELPASGGDKPGLQCSHCGAALEEGLAFCTSCGNALDESSHDETRCPHCGTMNPSDLSFCLECGKSTSVEPKFSHMEKPIVRSADEGWQCDFCLQENHSAAGSCSTCGRTRTEHREPANRYLRPLTSSDLIGEIHGVESGGEEIKFGSEL